MHSNVVTAIWNGTQANTANTWNLFIVVLGRFD